MRRFLERRAPLTLKQVDPLIREYHPKTPTLGLRLRTGEARAYPASELARAGGAVRERFAGWPVRVA